MSNQGSGEHEAEQASSADHKPTKETRQQRQLAQFDYSRTVAFSDGVFAIAITLIVLTIDVPSRDQIDSDQLWGALADQADQFYAYVLSFAVIGLFWYRHHRFFAGLRVLDGRLIGLNLLYFAFIVFIPFATELLGEYNDNAIAVTIYAATVATVSLITTLMNHYASKHKLFDPKKVGSESGPGRAYIFYLIPGVFLFSIVLAWTISPVVAMYSWYLMFLITIVRRIQQRAERRAQADPRQ